MVVYPFTQVLKTQNIYSIWFDRIKVQQYPKQLQKIEVLKHIP